MTAALITRIGDTELQFAPFEATGSCFCEQDGATRAVSVACPLSTFHSKQQDQIASTGPPIDGLRCEEGRAIFGHRLWDVWGAALRSGVSVGAMRLLGSHCKLARVLSWVVGDSLLLQQQRPNPVRSELQLSH